MKTRKNELDVDTIGVQSPLTASEEKALSDYFKQRKALSPKSTTPRKTKRTKRAAIK